MRPGPGLTRLGSAILLLLLLVIIGLPSVRPDDYTYSYDDYDYNYDESTSDPEPNPEPGKPEPEIEPEPTTEKPEPTTEKPKPDPKPQEHKGGQETPDDFVKIDIDDTNEECPQFHFDSCDFRQRMCKDDPVNHTAYCPGGTVRWLKDLTSDESGRRRGVLVINPTPDTQCVQIFLGVQDPKGWSFGITDLLEDGTVPPPANGFDAEMHANNKQLILYENVRWRINNVGPPVPLDFFGDFFIDDPTRFDLTISKDRLMINTFPHVKGTHFEASDNQMLDITRGLGVGVNRDPAEPLIWSTSGTGIYDICVKFH